MNSPGLQIAVVGCGSIGQRHLANLASIEEGLRLLAVDPQPERRESAASLADADPLVGIEEALSRRPDAIVVATPTHLHVEAIEKGLAAGCHLFVEKPLAARSEGVRALLEEADRKNLLVMVGYNLRFHPGVQALCSLVRSGEIGQVIWVRAEYGWYLPNWRPARDYRQTYSARRDQGGGVLLDVSHEIDLLRYLLGEATQVQCVTGNTGTLGIDVEEVAAVTCGFAGGVLGEAHLDFLQRAYCRTCKVVGTEGTAVWDYTGEKLSVFDAKRGAWTQQAWEEFEPAQAYVDEMREFVSALRQQREPRPSGWEGLRTLMLVEAAARSAASGREESLGKNDGL